MKEIEGGEDKEGHAGKRVEGRGREKKKTWQTWCREKILVQKEERRGMKARK